MCLPVGNYLPVDTLEFQSCETEKEKVKAWEARVVEWRKSPRCLRGSNGVRLVRVEHNFWKESH